MTKSKYVFVEGNDYLTVDMFVRHGYNITSVPEGADIVCFTGGDDVSPEMYREENDHSFTDYTRDLECVGVYSRVHWRDKVMIGICRGGQFLNVMLGGTMIQHVEGHSRDGHLMHGPDDTCVPVRSCHHQGMVPNHQLEHTVYYATDEVVAEIIIYPEYNTMCFQPHPEYMPEDSLTENLFFEMLEEVCAN